MSWILGAIGNFTRDDVNIFHSIHSKSLKRHQIDKIYIAMGGIPETCHHNFFSPSASMPHDGWIACGVGIDYKADQFQIMKSADWHRVLSNKKSNLNHLNGHFVVILWNQSEVRCFTDQLGFRNLYMTKLKGYAAFSTRLDWLAKLRGDCEIDLKAFGSRWLLVNQLNQECILTNIQRITQGGQARLTSDSIETENRPWECHYSRKFPDFSYRDLLERLSTFPIGSQKELSLAFSGGVDSRVLLSIIKTHQSHGWSLHTFGTNSDPDVQIAGLISRKLDKEHLVFDIKFPAVEESISRLRDYIGQTYVRLPASQFLKFQFYSDLYEQNRIAIDGGQGELHRREFFNRLLFYGKKALLKNEFEKIYPLICRHRASIFRDDILENIKENALADVRNLSESLPAIQKIGLAHWLDLFIIRYGFPNTSNLEQIRSDAELVNYTPFAQPSLIDKMFELPISVRNNGRILRRTLKENLPELQKYPRAKNGVILPFYFSAIPTRLWIKVNQKIGRFYQDSTNIKFLNGISEFVLDTLHSSAVKTCPFYDYNKIHGTVNEFYDGNEQLADEVDWWLAFEIWRQLVYGK